MKLNYRRIILIGLAFMSICAFWQLFDGLIPLMLENTFGLGETITGFIMALDNILALFMLPMFGALSDKIKSPLGRRMPFIAVGTLLAVIFMIFIPIANNQNNFVLFFVSLGMVLLAMGTYRSPAVALMPDLTPKPLRSKANAIINLMGALGGVYTLIMIKLTVGEDNNYLNVYLTVIFLMVVSVLILLFTIRENKLISQIPEENTHEHLSDQTVSETRKMSKPVLKSLILLLISVFLWFTAYNAVTTAYSRYVQNVWGRSGGAFAGSLLVGTIAAVLSYVPIGFISVRIGRKKVIMTGIVLMTIAYITMAISNEYNSLMFIMLIVIGIGWAAINVNSYPMVVEMSSNSDVGKYTGYYYTFSMAAQTLTPVLSGFLIENTSLKYRVLFPYAVLFSVAAFITMIFVKHGDTISANGIKTPKT
ncbi:MAG: MFS transporter [Eubacteriales bacterium]|nr:MFS transporter [Eubacteriales bacterium]